MQVFYCDHIELPLPPGHRFPLAKYRRTRELVEQRLADRVTLVPAPEATQQQLERVHSEEYLQQVFHGELSEIAQKRIGFPWSPEMLRRSLHSTGATVAAANVASECRLAAHLSGGTHHAFADEGQGFCVFNDVAVAAKDLLFQGLASRILIVDLDVHQGNGTASIFQNDARVFTFSMHGDRNYPFRKTEGDLDIGLPDGTDDATYLSALQDVFQRHVPVARADFCFYIAGADPYLHDRMGRLKLSSAGLARRDEWLLQSLLDANIPTAIVMGGGYAEVEEVANIHATTIEIAVNCLEASHSNSS